MENESGPLDLQTIKEALVETGLTPDNQLEEDVLQYMPAIREIIKTGRDVDESFKQIANTLGLTQTRFKRLYMAVKKEMQIQADMRGGPDLRLELMNNRDEKLARLERERAEFIKKHKEACELHEKVQNLEHRKAHATDEEKESIYIPEIPPYKLVYVFMKPEAYYKTLKGFDDAIAKINDSKEKLSGVLVQKKEIVKKDAAALLEALFKGKNPMQRPEDVVVDAEFVEIQEENALISLKDD